MLINTRKSSAKFGSEALSRRPRQLNAAKSLQELLVLGRLLAGSCGGNELLHALKDFSTDEKPVTARAFNSLMNRLLADRSIQLHAARRLAREAEQQAVYRIAAQGLARFQSLMSCEDGSLGSRQGFRAKLLLIDHVRPETRQRIARSYMQRIKCAQIQAIAKTGFFQHDAQIGDPDRTMMLRMLRRERAIAQAEFDWMNTDMAKYL